MYNYEAAINPPIRNDDTYDTMDYYKDALITAFLVIVPKSHVATFVSIVTEAYIEGNNDAFDLMKSMGMGDLHVHAWRGDCMAFLKEYQLEEESFYVEV